MAFGPLFLKHMLGSFTSFEVAYWYASSVSQPCGMASLGFQCVWLQTFPDLECEGLLAAQEPDWHLVTQGFQKLLLWTIVPYPAPTRHTHRQTDTHTIYKKLTKCYGECFRPLGCLVLESVAGGGTGFQLEGTFHWVIPQVDHREFWVFFPLTLASKDK